MDTRTLEEIGLTKGEISVYISLLRLGSCTITPLVKESKVSKSKVYDILDRLIGKGLVSYVIKANRKSFQAAPPKTILDFLDEKRKNVKQILPELNLLTQGKAEQDANVYSGFKGYKAAREKLMKEMRRGDTLEIAGAPAEANERIEAWLLDFHKRREEKGVKMKIIYNKDARKYGKVRKKWKGTKVRYAEDSTPSWFELFRKSMIIGVASSTPLTFVITNKEVVDSFRSHFNIIWRTSTE